MMAEFAQRINCGGATAGATSSFMREMMQSSTRVSYDNTLALQTFYDEEEDDPPVSDADAQHLAFMKTLFSLPCCLTLLSSTVSLSVVSQAAISVHRQDQHF